MDTSLGAYELKHKYFSSQGLLFVFDVAAVWTSCNSFMRRR